MLDFLFIGGGLSGGLAAYRLHKSNPNLKILVLDGENSQNKKLKTWSFQTIETNNDPSIEKTFSRPDSSWLKPFISKTWSSYAIKFPRYERVLHEAYHSIRSEDFYEVLKTSLGERIREAKVVARPDANTVILQNEETIKSKVIIDASGWGEIGDFAGYQKFFGLQLRLKKPHGLKYPTLMDARVPQKDGFRFIYLLPWTSHELLVEDTRYSIHENLDSKSIELDIKSYLLEQGFEVESILSSEQGSLPLPGFDHRSSPAREGFIGVAGGLFQPTTGYSIYEAVQMAERIAEWSKKPSEWHELPQKIYLWANERWEAQEFYRRLNNMMFHAAEDAERYQILERFYEHDQSLIARFYAGRTNLIDKVKIMSGKPPIPMQKAIACYFQRITPKQEAQHA